MDSRLACSLHRGPSCFIILIAILSLLTFLPLVNVGITTTDDMVYSSLHQSSGFFWSFAKSNAISQGRFAFPVHAALVTVAYAFGSIRIAHLIGLSTVILSALLLSGIIRKLGFRAVSNLALCLFLLSAANTQEHSLFTSYPITVPFGLCLIFLATHLELFATRRNWRISVLVVVLFFTGFCAIVESSLVYALLPFSLAALTSSTSIAQACISSRRHLLYPLLAVTLYLSCYLIFRLSSPPASYEGNAFAFHGLLPFLGVVYQYTVAGFPGYLSLGLNSEVISSQLSIADLTLNPVALCAGLCAGLLPFVIFGSSVREPDAKPRHFGLLLIVMLGFAIFPQVPLGLTSKYVRWVHTANSNSYATTFLSILFIAVSLSLIIVVLHRVASHCRALFVTGLKMLLAVVFAVLAISTSIWNQHISRDQVAMQKRWDLVDAFLQSENRAALLADSVMVAPTLFEPKGITTVPDWYWSRYFEHELGAPFTVARDLSGALKTRPNNNVSSWSALHVSTDSLDCSALAFAPLGRSAPEASSRMVKTASVYVDSDAANVGLIFRRGDDASIATAGKNITGSVKLLHMNVKSRVWTEIRSEDAFYLETLELTKAEPSLLRQDVMVSYGPGFWGLEWSDTDLWQWSLGQSDLIIHNQSGIPRKVQFKCTLVTYRIPRAVQVSYGSEVSTNVLLEPGKGRQIVLALSLEPGQNRLTFSSPEPAPQPVGGESRGLTFGVFNPMIE